jgi:hypothetical protein
MRALARIGRPGAGESGADKCVVRLKEDGEVGVFGEVIAGEVTPGVDEFVVGCDEEGEVGVVDEAVAVGIAAARARTFILVSRRNGWIEARRNLGAFTLRRVAGCTRR